MQIFCPTYYPRAADMLGSAQAHSVAFGVANLKILCRPIAVCMYVCTYVCIVTSIGLLLREYSPILFRAQINAFKMLQASIPVLRTLVFRFFRKFNDFHPCKASVGEAHLPNWYIPFAFVCQKNSA